MFIRESSYLQSQRKSPVYGHTFINLDGQRHWRVNEASDAAGIGIPGRCVYAQNDAYLELCNPGWSRQWWAGLSAIGVVLTSSLIILAWYGFAVHPLLFKKVMFVFPWLMGDYEPGTKDVAIVWFGWLLCFPMAIGASFLLYLSLVLSGMRTGFFTYLRGRVRFNRKTRKVYVLRPGYCGGNKVFEWDRLLGLLEASPADGRQFDEFALALYHPPFDPNDPKTKGEDCIFVGPELIHRGQAAGLWEYIRRYMEIGPTVDEIPDDVTETYKQIPRVLPEPYTTYCGKPSIGQYGLEQKPRILQTPYHMLSQVTCYWPKFPKEWQSDSGVGEPEDKPVQTGAVMTALVYRAKGKLSKADEIELMRRYGTEEGLAEALGRMDT